MTEIIVLHQCTPKIFQKSFTSYSFDCENSQWKIKNYTILEKSKITQKKVYMSLWCGGSPMCEARVLSSFLWRPSEFNQSSLAFAPQLLLFTNRPCYLYIALLPSKELLSESTAFFLGPPSRLPRPLISFAQVSPLSSPALVPSQPTRVLELYLLLFPPPQKSHQTQREDSFCLGCDHLTERTGKNCHGKNCQGSIFHSWLRSRKYMRDQDYIWLTFALWILLSSWSFRWCRKSRAPTECIISLWRETHKTHKILKITLIQVSFWSGNHQKT